MVEHNEPIKLEDEFHIRARRDLKSSKKLMKEEDFGNSAYLLQQCVEKYVKAIVYKHDLINAEPRKLGHFPLINLISKLGSTLKSRGTSKNYSIMKEIKQILDDVDLLLRYKKNNERSHEIWINTWKDSLNIPIDNKNKIASLLNLGKAKPKFKKVIARYEKLYDTEQPKMSEESKKLCQGVFDSIEKCIRLHETNKFEFDNKSIDETSKLLSKVLELISRDEFKRCRKFISAFPQLICLFLILALSNVIIKTHPHESIGRYPIEIDGKSSRLWYQERRLDLGKLSNEVETTCKKLDDILSI